MYSSLSRMPSAKRVSVGCRSTVRASTRTPLPRSAFHSLRDPSLASHASLASASCSDQSLYHLSLSHRITGTPSRSCRRPCAAGILPR